MNWNCYFVILFFNVLKHVQRLNTQFNGLKACCHVVLTYFRVSKKNIRGGGVTSFKLGF